MTDWKVRLAKANDSQQVYDLYRAVAKHNPGTINQNYHQITIQYVQNCLKEAAQRGVAFVVQTNNSIVAFIKAFTTPYQSFAHILGDVTILVNPAQQKQKIGYNLMLRFHEHIKMYMKHILIVQLLPHDINIKAIEMYKRLGYNITHESKRKLRNPDGSFGAQVLMEWINPQFSKEQLLQYDKYLSQYNSIEVHPNAKIKSYQLFKRQKQISPKL